jgi:hypothetical protein
LETRWAPDGARFVFVEAGSRKLMLSNASGGRVVPVDPDPAQITARGYWSPDGQWLAYQRSQAAAPFTSQIVKIKPGSTGTAEILWTSADKDLGRARVPFGWSPTGDWILTQGEAAAGLFLLSPDGKIERKLTGRQFGGFGFSKDGHQVLGIYRNTTGQGAEWQLYSVDVPTGAEKLLANVDLPITTSTIYGFSLHPDGTRFATSIGKWPYDIWMLEGFDKP